MVVPLHSVRIILSKLRAFPFPPCAMDDCAAGIPRASCHLPKEAQGIEPCAADGRALYLDRTPLEAIAGIADDPKRGLLP